MIEFYKDPEKKLLRPGLFSEEAQEEAKDISSGLTSSQFRNYFQELRALEARFKRDRKQNAARAWDLLLPQLHMMKAKVAYGSREKGNITVAFRKFMDKLLDSGMRSAEDFTAMMLYVEAVLAYFYAQESEAKRRRDAERQQGRRR